MRRENEKTIYEIGKPPFKRLKLFFEKSFFKKKQENNSRFFLLGKIKYFTLGFLFSFIFIFIPVVSFIAFNLLPSPEILAKNLAPQTTKIYDRNGNLLTEIYADQNRTKVSLNKIPKNLKNATIAIEDKSFYQNPGFDIFSIFRAFISDITGQQFEGGSTITQQLIKSELLNSQISVSRKIEEVMLSFWAQKIYSKDQVLEMYLNQVPYGGSAWGVESGAQTYFNTDVWNLDLAQCAFLAGLPQAPSVYSPFTGSSLWKNRQILVLSRMLDLGYISKKQQQEAEKEKLVFKQKQNFSKAPHFTDYVINSLEKKYGSEIVEKGGLRVITTLDLNTQNMAQKIVTDEVNKDNYLNLTNAAALITDPETGDILAMVGSEDYNNPQFGQVNLTTSLRQPGSSIKIVTYSLALKKGFRESSLINDVPTCFPDGNNNYCPVNYDHKFHGIVPLYLAFANSFNIPAVKTLQAVGVTDFINQAKLMGISNISSNKYIGLSATLGGIDVTMLDMATAYDTLANFGSRVNLDPILKVTDANGSIIEQKTISQNQVIDPGIAYIISNILSNNNARSWEFGTNSPLFIPNQTVAVKTGTTDDIRDNWTIGYTPNRAVTVWVGNNNNTPMNPNLVSGITGAAPIWHSIMENLLKGEKDTKFTIPSDIYSQNCQGRVEYFLKGTSPTPIECNWKFQVPVITPSPTNNPIPSISMPTPGIFHINLPVNGNFHWSFLP